MNKKKQYFPSIIIEGCDCSGKTTLAKNIKKYLEELGADNISTMHCTSKDPKDVDYYYQLMRSKNTIFDRHFLGEMIYPDVFKRLPELTEYEYDTLMDRAKLLGVKIIVMCPPNEILRERLRNERPNEEPEVISSVEMINNSFTKLAENAVKKYDHVLIVNPSDGNVDLESVKKFLNFNYSKE